MFVQGQSRCNRRVGDFQTLTSWPCECEGFRPINGALSEATFAEASPPHEDDPLGVRLRLA